MKYKVGDRVKIKSLDWYNENKDEYGNIPLIEKTYSGYNFIEMMRGLCGKVMTISRVCRCYYDMVEDNGKYYWTDEMIEGLVEEETKSEPKFRVGDKVMLDSYPCKITDVHWRDSLHGFVYTVRGNDFGKIVKEDELIFDERPIPTTDEIIKNIKADWDNFKNRYNLPNEYHFVDKNGNEVDISDIVLEKKKKEYPKTYGECCKILGLNDLINMHLSFMDEDAKISASTNYHIKTLILLNCLTKLRICRDAYWKIAGEEMKLGEPWEPDWTDDNAKYSIYTIKGVLTKAISCYDGAILTFPTEEMRDAFYENFKGLIEQCKELL